MQTRHWELLLITLHTVKCYTSLPEGNKGCHPKWASNKSHPTEKSVRNLRCIWQDVAALWCSSASRQRSCYIIKRSVKEGGGGTKNVLGPVKRFPAVKPAIHRCPGVKWHYVLIDLICSDWQVPIWRWQTPQITANYLTEKITCIDTCIPKIF